MVHFRWYDKTDKELQVEERGHQVEGGILIALAVLNVCNWVALIWLTRIVFKFMRNVNKNCERKDDEYD